MLCRQSIFKLTYPFIHQKMLSTCLVLIADGTEEIECITTVDILRRGQVNTLLLAVKNDTTCECSQKVKIVADDTLERFMSTKKPFDCVVIPGGSKGAETMANSTTVKNLLKVCEQEKKMVAAICHGPRTFKMAGVFHQRKITCHPTAFEELSKDYKVSKEKRVEMDGMLLTSQGPGTTMEFALVLLEKLVNKKAMEEVSHPLILQPSVKTTV